MTSERFQWGAFWRDLSNLDPAAQRRMHDIRDRIRRIHSFQNTGEQTTEQLCDQFDCELAANLDRLGKTQADYIRRD